MEPRGCLLNFVLGDACPLAGRFKHLQKWQNPLLSSIQKDVEKMVVPQKTSKNHPKLMILAGKPPLSVQFWVPRSTAVASRKRAVHDGGKLPTQIPATRRCEMMVMNGDG